MFMNKIKIIFFVVHFSLFIDGEEESSFLKHNLCTQENEYYLDSSGKNSSLYFDLYESSRENQNFCSLIVHAPKNFVINIQVLIDNVILSEINKNSSCPIYVYNTQPNKRLLWTIDLCHETRPRKSELLASDLEINWVKGDLKLLPATLIVTALAIGSECNSEIHYQCWHTGLGVEAVSICVARDLLCDGIVHCPLGTAPTDEDRHICRIRHFLTGSLETGVQNLYRQYMEERKTIDQNNNWQLTDEKIQLINVILNSDSTTTEEPVVTEYPSLSNTITGNLSKYSPWSYLTLFMLVCASVLTLCSFFRCLWHKTPKYNANIHPNIIIAHPQPSTMNRNLSLDNFEVDNNSQSPPRYDELDFNDTLLPSYSSLFPTGKECECLRKQCENEV